MRIKKALVQFFVSTLGIKLLSAVFWVVFIYTVLLVFAPSSRPLSKAGFVMSIIVVLIERAPIYPIWTILFVLLRMVVLKRKAMSFSVILSLTLVLNFAEHLLLYSHFGRIVQISKHYGLFHTETWAALPDFPEVLSLIIASVIFAVLYHRFVEKS